MSEYNSERAKEKLLERIRHDKRNMQKNLVRKVFNYAAVGLVLMGLGYGYHKWALPNDTGERVKIYKNAITLQLSDGTVKKILEEKSTSIVNGNGNRVGLQKGNHLIYHKTFTSKRFFYNTLSVPNGKQFVLVLSDGTKAHLNSGTTLKYPVQFKYGENREVFLQGEGYFEVAKDRDHPFIVNTDALNIRVLGTRFDISAYPDDKDIKTVLIEGSVGFFEKNQEFDSIRSRQLKPGHIANWTKENKEMTIGKTNTELYTAWMDGKIIFNHMPFNQVCKVLERNYNITITNNYRELDRARFTASFDTETIEQVLMAFSKNYPMHYNIKENNIYIEKP